MNKDNRIFGLFYKFPGFSKLLINNSTSFFINLIFHFSHILKLKQIFEQNSVIKILIKVAIGQDSS